MANRVGTFTAFASTSPPWSLPALDANFSAISTFANDSSLGFLNGVPTDTGTANNYVVTLPYGAPSAYNQGFTLAFIPANTNTAGSSIIVNPLGTSLPIVDWAGNALTAGALVAGRMAVMICTGTAFRLVTISNLVSGGVPYYYDYDDLIVLPSQTANAWGTKLLVGWTQNVGAGVSAPYTTQIAGHYGLWNLQAGSGNAAMLAVVAPGDSAPMNGSGLFLDNLATVTLRASLYVNAVSTANNDITFGLWSTHGYNVATSAKKFFGFLGNATLNSNWLAYANTANTSVTSVSTGVALSAGTWYDLQFTYTGATGIGTFLINQNQVATISTNIPINTNLFPGFEVVSAGGASNSQIFPDTFEILVNLGTGKRFLYGAI